MGLIGKYVDFLEFEQRDGLIQSLIKLGNYVGKLNEESTKFLCLCVKYR